MNKAVQNNHDFPYFQRFNKSMIKSQEYKKFLAVNQPLGDATVRK